MKYFRVVIAVLGFLLTIISYSSLQATDSINAPKPEWQKKAAEYSAAHDGVSMLVLVDGKVKLEEYPNGGGADKAWQLASGAKSFWGPLALIAEKEKLFTLDELVCDTITEWKSDPLKSRITVRHLLSLTSGIPRGRELFVTYNEAIQTKTTVEPGKLFQYSSASYQSFGEFLKRKLQSKKMSPLDYLITSIFEPIDLKVDDWNKGKDGNPEIPFGAHLTAREWAKYGELIRFGGKWKGKEIIPETLSQCFHGSAANASYGITWWLNTRKNLPSDLVFAAGLGDQRMYVCPSMHTVAIRQHRINLRDLRGAARTPGAGRSFSDAEFCSLLFTGDSAKSKTPMVQMNPD
jgi:CubicO group peptidase (beta-lactamase class C family)